MATIVATDVKGQREKVVVETTLTASDTFTYKANARQKLVLRNASAGALTPLITGADSTTVNVTGIGPVDVSTGFQMASIGVGAVVSIDTDSIKEYLKGTIEITGGTDIVATLMEG